SYMKFIENYDRKIVSIFVSDHGFTGDNHGLSSEQESTSWLAYHQNFKSDNRVIESELKLRTISQIDLCTTLAFLLNVDVPKLSIGINLPGLTSDSFHKKLLVHMNTLLNIKNN
ncbi:MAG: hypothetical protein MHPSP_004048, partial [Paramarteilia canceri]